MIHLTDDLLSYERVRAVHAEWDEVARALERCARRFEEMGEGQQARALRADLAHLVRRASLHLRQVAAHEQLGAAS